MKKHARKFASLGTSTVALLLAGVTMIAQSPAAQPNPSTDSSHRRQAPADGITVHGHWTIDVRNPDGALASHNEFENALEPSGATALSGLLARSSTLGSWQLDLIGANAGGPCVQAPPPSGNATFVLALVSNGAVTFNPQTNSWTTTATPTPGAPVLMDPGGGGSPLLIYELSLPVGEIFGSLFVVQNMAQSFFWQASGTIPGLSLNFSGNIPPDFTSNWDTRGVSPGTYGATFTIFEGNPSVVPINTYQIIATIPASQGTPLPSIPCSAVEPGTAISSDLAAAWFPTLALTQVQGAGGTPALELSGSVTASSAEPIEQVRSVVVLSPSGARTPFSSRTLPTPIQVAAGQQIYVKVVLSFS